MRPQLGHAPRVVESLRHPPTRAQHLEQLVVAPASTCSSSAEGSSAPPSPRMRLGSGSPSPSSRRGTSRGGTSSASSKLIHGGLRYLRLGDVRLVREAHHERRVLTKIVAPHLVRRIAVSPPAVRARPVPPRVRAERHPRLLGAGSLAPELARRRGPRPTARAGPTYRGASLVRALRGRDDERHSPLPRERPRGRRRRRVRAQPRRGRRSPAARRPRRRRRGARRRDGGRGGRAAGRERDAARGSTRCAGSRIRRPAPRCG